MWKCKHCKKEFGFTRTTEKANHTRWCDQNPEIERLREENAQRQKMVAEQKYGEFKDFTVICDFCDKQFEVSEREYLPRKNKYFCGRSCSNHRGTGIEWAAKRAQSLQRYRTICFAYHKKECIVCNEKHLVAVHHLNENHEDNRPENLIPMCPTHHEYMHSSWKYLIEEKVHDYIEKWKAEEAMSLQNAR